MARRRQAHGRKRIGRVSYYAHHGAWYIYYREGGRPVRRRVGETEAAAEQVAARVNAQLAADSPTQFDFTPVAVSELRRRFLSSHEEVRRSSLSTVRRYRAATQHLENFVELQKRPTAAHELDAERFVAWLRQQLVSPNGHAHTPRRRLRDKGLRYILEVCRSMYAYARKRRHLPPDVENPFSQIDIERMPIEDAKPIFVFDAGTELSFLQAADPWTLAVHFTLAKTGLRPGELAHLLIEDLDLDGGWLRVRNKPELGWRIKTRRERSVPLLGEVVTLLRAVIGHRTAGPVFLRQKFDPVRSPLRPANDCIYRLLCRGVIGCSIRRPRV